VLSRCLSRACLVKRSFVYTNGSKGRVSYQDVEDLDVRDGGAPCNPTSSTLTTCPLDRSVCPEPVLVKHAFFLIKEDQNRRSFFSLVQNTERRAGSEAGLVAERCRLSPVVRHCVHQPQCQCNLVMHQFHYQHQPAQYCMRANCTAPQ
jgi:hypothetical protein